MPVDWAIKFEILKKYFWSLSSHQLPPITLERYFGLALTYPSVVLLVFNSIVK